MLFITKTSDETRQRGHTLSTCVCVRVLHIYLPIGPQPNPAIYALAIRYAVCWTGCGILYLVVTHLCFNSSSLCPGRRRWGRRYWCLHNPDHLIRRCYYRLQSPPPPRRLCHRRITQESLKKNMNVSRPSEHPPVRGEKCQNVLVGS